MATRTRYTYKDYVLFPEDGKRHELIEGEHLVTPAPFTRHQRLVHRILRAIGDRAKGLGEAWVSPVDVLFSEDTVVQPDVLFVSNARSSIVTEKNIQGAPDLVVEVLSESTRKTDATIKRKLYAAHGVPEYWLVDPELETVAVYRAPSPGAEYRRAAELSLESEDSISSEILGGAPIPLAEIFQAREK